MKQARKADGKNGQEILDYFLSINPECNRVMGWNVNEINDISDGINFWFINSDGRLTCEYYVPDGYELIEPSGESEFDKAFLKLKITNLLLSATGFGNYGKPLSDIEVTEKLIEIAEAYSTQQNKELKEEIERLKECLKSIVINYDSTCNLDGMFDSIYNAKQLIK